MGGLAVASADSHQSGRLLPNTARICMQTRACPDCQTMPCPVHRKIVERGGRQRWVESFPRLGAGARRRNDDRVPHEEPVAHKDRGRGGVGQISFV
jgi:hypothetical protein